ncbi:cytochrome c oxidase accessory protein CcoG [Novipirellula artificiosorum]|uniref:Ubp3 associated protein Bre5 n=1 Tax=Novipirellula artificiosorum TaxID=2528016 RepID=A0A5C6DSH6_9BACT|nr:cytochrome c oxidase accessory protein CcoG [Novipirellula artificiosorum]TWU38441.1 Ubp3 associated protein Bre5 [Novipirellula artificiosorum]
MSSSTPPSDLPIAGEKSGDSLQHSAMLEAPDHVLSTLEKDGSRRWLRPRLSRGFWWKRRRAFAYALMAFFIILPHVRFGGMPPVLLDIPARRFVFLGHTFLPTDTLLLALVMLGGFLTIVLATALTGRVWCGWACPQTVYMEYVFRPIDRLFEGTKGKGGKPKHKIEGWRRLARWAVYLLLCFLLANTFIAYFVGTDRLGDWMRSSPLEHPIAFVVMGGVTALMMFDFLYFREQTCLIACPYGRFQSVMLDRQSLIVAYDPNRGEPRKKGRRKPDDGAGDCVACNQCVVVCPTGIDIRDGLQLECINCTQCIDACDSVMTKVGKPTGLIRYSSQDALTGNPPKLFRLRTVAYPALLLAVGIAFIGVLSTKYAFDARVIRGKGSPFTRQDQGTISNQFRLRLVNRTNETRQYTIEMVEPESATIHEIEVEKPTLQSNGTTLVPIMVEIPTKAFGPSGNADGKMRVTDDVGNERFLKMQLLGPRR